MSWTTPSATTRMGCHESDATDGARLLPGTDSAAPRSAGLGALRRPGDPSGASVMPTKSPTGPADGAPAPQLAPQPAGIEKALAILQHGRAVLLEHGDELARPLVDALDRFIAGGGLCGSARLVGRLAL